MMVWLILPLGSLLLIAIGPHIVWRGQIVATLDLPAVSYRLFDPVRAAGRLVWPAMYAIVLAAILAAFRLRTATAVVIAAAAVQLIELSPMLRQERAGTGAADRDAIYSRLVSDARWRRLIGSADAILFAPPEFNRDLALVEEIAWRAVTACRPIPLRNFYASRLPQRLQDRMMADQAALSRGERRAGDLVILLGDPPPPLAAQAKRLDGVLYLPPTRPRSPDECRTRR